MNEAELREIEKKIENEYNLDLHINENKLYYEGIGEYITSDEDYYEVESLCISICGYICGEYDVFCDYSILDEGYKFIIEIF